MSEKQTFPSDAADKVLVRMPDGMRDRLKDAAKSNNRTMNAEIVARLEGSFAVEAFPARDQAELDAMLDISMAQMEFHVAQDRVAEARAELSNAEFKRDSLALHERAIGKDDPDLSFAAELRALSLSAREEVEVARLKLKKAEIAYQDAQARLTNSHLARVRNRPQP